VASRVLPFAVTIPPGTLKSAPYVQDLVFDNWQIESMDLEVPAGSTGCMGFQVWNNGVPWLPYGAGEWLVWDNVVQNWPLTDQPNASGWAIAGYNSGNFPHTVTVRFHVNPPTPVAVVTGPAPITIVTAAPDPAATVTT
jgi:hypothetical protein